MNSNSFIEKPEDCPIWAFDGSSTWQAETGDSDRKLKPVRVVMDPMRGYRDILVLCEVMNMDGSPHVSNSRARLRAAVERYKDQEPLVGIEQEYTLFGVNGRPYGWPPSDEEMAPQGGYYCAVGTTNVYGRDLIEKHMDACLRAGLKLYGINSEVMASQWEFQIGTSDPLEVADHLWLGRWLLHRLGECYYAVVSFSPKPKEGDWNGAGAHTNFSTKAMREEGGLEQIMEACVRLEQRHLEHMKVYGEGNDKRLTGKHETCDINTFRYGVGHRGASIRIPAPVAEAGRGYLEDRRPAANMDPYLVCVAILETVCGEGFKP